MVVLALRPWDVGDMMPAALRTALCRAAHRNGRSSAGRVIAEAFARDEEAILRAIIASGACLVRADGEEVSFRLVRQWRQSMVDPTRQDRKRVALVGYCRGKRLPLLVRAENAEKETDA